MNRIAELDTEKKVKYISIDGVKDLFGGNLIKEAVVFRDPDGYALIFYVSKLEGEDFKNRFPAIPIVYGQYITVEFPGDEEQKAEKAIMDLEIRDCPIMGENGKYVNSGRRDDRDRWLNENFYQDGIKQHEDYYEEAIGWKRHTKLINEDKKFIQYEYELEGHFLVSRTSVKAHGALSGSGDTNFNMGGNKGLVPVPHYGVNTDYLNFSKMRDSIKSLMKKHDVPKDAGVSLSYYGHAPGIDLLNAFSSLFPTDPDTCMSLLCCDPSGNVAEMKWYLDFGEMFHHKGEVGMNDMLIDNSMLEYHFPEKALEKLRSRNK